jgi:lysophospholipase L1-like esterase
MKLRTVQIVQRTLLVAGATAVGLLAAEIFLHLFATRPVIASEWLLDRPDMMDEDSIFSSPEFRKGEHYEVDQTLPIMVALGDSFTERYPVAHEDSYPAVLARLLEKSGSPANVIALGMGDAGPDQQLVVFEREVLPRLTPDVVVWQLYANDEGNNIDRAAYTIAEGRLERLDAERNWLYRRTLFYERVPFHDTLRQNSFLFRYLLKVAELAENAAVPAAYESDPKAWARDKIRLEIARMDELAAKHDFRSYLLLVAPEALSLSIRSREEAPPHVAEFARSYERLLKLLERRADFIDARFYEADARTPRDDIWINDGRDPLSPGGRHFDETGYGLLAELVFERLREDGRLR